MTQKDLRYRGIISAPMAALEVFVSPKALKSSLLQWFRQQDKGERVITKISVAFDNGPAAEFTLTEDRPWQEKVIESFNNSATKDTPSDGS